MTIRYVRDGLRVVRVVDAPRLSPATLTRVAEAAAASPDLRYRLRLFNATILADAARARTTERQPLHAKPRRSPEPASGVTAEELRLARTLAGLSQRQLADRLGFGRGLVADAELKRRSVPQSMGTWARSVLEGQER